MSNTVRDPNHEQPLSPPLEPATTPDVRIESSRIEGVEAAVRGFSIVVGGPIYNLLLRSGLVRHGLPNVLRRIIALVAITWLPLLFLSLKAGFAIGNRVNIPLLLDFSTYGRLLLALPLLLLAEVIVDPGIRIAVEEFVDTGIVQENELAEFAGVLKRVQGVRDSAIPELILLILAFFPTIVFQHEWKPGVISSWHSTAHGLSAAGWWYAAISAPVLRFTLYRWIFRYVVWALLLWWISRLRLHLMPTHPDRAAGLNFLSITQSRFGILFCALGCMLAGNVANSVIREGAALASFKILIPGFIVLSVVVGLCPLALLTPKMVQVRRRGLREYATLGNLYTEAFDRKWVHFAERPAEPLLGTPDIQSLADLGNSYAIIEQMSIAPISKRLAVQFGLVAGAPIIPVVFVATPTSAIVHAILKMLM